MLPRRDEFDPNFEWEHVLFTAILGLGLGLLLAGLSLLVRDRRSRAGLTLLVAGLALGMFVALVAVDASPVARVGFRLKPYLSDLAEASVITAGGLATAVAVAGACLFAARRKSPVVLAAAAVAVFGVAGIGLWYLDWYVAERAPRHPAGTETGQLAQSTRVIAGLSVPTGLAVAPNGDLATVELIGGDFRLYSQVQGQFELRIRQRLPIGERQAALRVAFHPDYPDEPVVFVTAQGGEGENRGLYVFRGVISGSRVAFETALGPFPSVALEDGGDHVGGGIAACGESLYVSTSDSELVPQQQAAVGSGATIRQRAQQLNSAEGKILRWRLDGDELDGSSALIDGIPVFGFGFRNPFGLACDPSSGELFAADNGSRGHDQVRFIGPGSNHGWPSSLDRDDIEPPLFDSGETHIAPTGVAVRAGPGEGRELLVSTFRSQAVYLLPLDDEGRPGRLRLLTEVEGGAYAVAVDARGCTYFTDADGVLRLDDERCSP